MPLEILSFNESPDQGNDEIPYLNFLEHIKSRDITYPAYTPKCLKRRCSCDGERAKGNDDYFDFPTIVNNVTIFTMPGLGEITNDRCGQWVNPLICPNYKKEDVKKWDDVTFPKSDNKKHHDRFMVQHHCHNANCPICYKNAANRQSKIVTEKLIQAHKLYKEIGVDLKTFRHWTFLIDPEEGIGACMTLEDAKKLRRQLYVHLKRLGCKGAVVIFHPFRQNDPKDEVGEYKYDIAPYAWYPSPHFHLVGCGFLEKSSIFYEETFHSWGYKMIREIDPNNTESLKKTISYIVGYQSSHCGIAKGWQAVTYFGCFHSSQLKKSTVKKEEKTIKCRLCGADLHSKAILLDDNEDMDWDNAPDLGVYTHIVKTTVYKINDRGRYGKLVIMTRLKKAIVNARHIKTLI